LLSQLTPEQIFDGLAISINGPRAWDLDIAIDVTLGDRDANYRLALRNGVLVQRRVPADAATATATIKLDSAFRLLTLAAGDLSSPGVDISGDQAALQQFLAVVERPDPSFNIITP
jgi:alkyl sulfatase BDS1-like metallo-beta-lactamase superfamily hydrolase